MRYIAIVALYVLVPRSPYCHARKWQWTYLVTLWVSRSWRECPLFSSRAFDSDGRKFKLYVHSVGHVEHLLLMPAASAFHTNQQPGLEAPFQNIQDQFGSLNFGSNEYLYGSNGFPDFPYPIFGHIDQLGGPSCARSSTQSVVYHKPEVIH